ncbi:hypothetical protein F8M41_016551 [Gigaspora margarita]|uniref:Uncharacterized protein n=1 Tax=Gigaspora margarita TaxID=4874 RepID=A0A8H4APD6_GIGMA|nr:hypothetical protein F8M41_016551 [Gigaspora margarita]
MQLQNNTVNRLDIRVNSSENIINRPDLVLNQCIDTNTKLLIDNTKEINHSSEKDSQSSAYLILFEKNSSNTYEQTVLQNEEAPASDISDNTSNSDVYQEEMKSRISALPIGSETKLLKEKYRCFLGNAEKRKH